jgi:hypothetical protein
MGMRSFKRKISSETKSSDSPNAGKRVKAELADRQVQRKERRSKRKTGLRVIISAISMPMDGIKKHFFILASWGILACD